MEIAPALAVSKPTRIRPSVVLPEPDSPTRPTLSPGRTSIETPLSARTAPPRWPVKTLAPLVTRMIAGLGSAGGIAAAASSAVSRSARISAAISGRRMQAVKRPGSSGKSGGLPARHRSWTQSQRSENAQRPATASARGTCPRMAISFGTRRSAGGSESSRPSV
jgi:hypothetical protein